jgi:U3 small nucleolar RNA-associated protein 14
MKRVILNEKIPKNCRNLMVKNVTHGYDTMTQFNMEQKNLLGQEWNT